MIMVRVIKVRNNSFWSIFYFFEYLCIFFFVEEYIGENCLVLDELFFF